MPNFGALENLEQRLSNPSTLPDECNLISDSVFAHLETPWLLRSKEDKGSYREM
jgi:hypothetical protein